MKNINILSIIACLLLISCSAKDSTKQEKNLVFNTLSSGIQSCGNDDFHPQDEVTEQYLTNANNGDTKAQLEMATIYFGVKDDFNSEKINKKEALRWVKKAADRGSAQGAYILASRYSTGDCLKLDNNQAKYYIDKAVELYKKENNEEKLKQAEGYQKLINQKIK